MHCNYYSFSVKSLKYVFFTFDAKSHVIFASMNNLKKKQVCGQYSKQSPLPPKIFNKFNFQMSKEVHESCPFKIDR